MNQTTVSIRTSGGWTDYDANTDLLPADLPNQEHLRAWLVTAPAEATAAA